MEDYYDRIVYVKNGRYSFDKGGRVASAGYEKRKKIIDALEDTNAAAVLRYNGSLYDVRVLYKNGKVVSD